MVSPLALCGVDAISNGRRLLFNKEKLLFLLLSRMCRLLFVFRALNEREREEGFRKSKIGIGPTFSSQGQVSL